MNDSHGADQASRPMPPARRLNHLDKMLAGMALLDAHLDRDEDRKSGMLSTMDPGEALESALIAAEVMLGFVDSEARFEATDVIAAMRRRILREQARAISELDQAG